LSPSFAAIAARHGTFAGAAEGYSGAVDPELWDVIKRYTIVAVVLVGALLWAVLYTTDTTRESNNKIILEAPVAANPVDAGPVQGSFVVVKYGVSRIACAPACELEASCELRELAACTNESCEGDVRKMNRSDFQLEGARACTDVVVTPCEEACWRKGECGGTHNGDAACTNACRDLMKGRPQKTWREARCILEVKSCDDVARCRES
jgi:hypothetical protein